MKALILLITLISLNTYALPIVNESVATNSIYTIYPDHKDNNLHYISPNFMSVALDEKGMPLFSYTEYKVGWRKYNATIQMVMRVQNYQEELAKAKETVLKNNPKAQFALVPFASSKLEFNDHFKGVFSSHNCDHLAGEYSAEQACSLNLSSLGRRIFKNNIAKRLTLVMNFSYQIQGVERRADDSFVDATRNFTLAARVGGDVLLEHPELFTDSRGYTIYL